MCGHFISILAVPFYYLNSFRVYKYNHKCISYSGPVICFDHIRILVTCKLVIENILVDFWRDSLHLITANDNNFVVLYAVHITEYFRAFLITLGNFYINHGTQLQIAKV